MDIIAVAAIIGGICCVAVPFATSRPGVRKKYAERDARSLLHTKVTAERMWKVCVAIAVLAPVPLSLIIPRLEPGIRKAIIAAMILIVMGGWCNFWAFWSVAGMAKAELEYRDRQKKESPNQPLERTSQ